MPRKKKVVEPTEEELAEAKGTVDEGMNGIEEHPDDLFLTASVTVNLHVADVLGRPVETDEEKELFLAVISSFFSSEPIYEQLKFFARFNMNPQTPPKPDLVVPEKRLILP